MGVFDYVKLNPPLKCSEGHELGLMQTKDTPDFHLGHYVVKRGRLLYYDEAFGIFNPPTPSSRPRAVTPAFTGRLRVYDGCEKCPTFVQRKTGNLVEVWVEYSVQVVKNRVVSIRRVSPSTAKWLKLKPKQPYMKGCLGPVPYDEALRLRNIEWAR